MQMATLWMAAYFEQVKKGLLFCILSAIQDILIILHTVSKSRRAVYFAKFKQVKNFPYRKTSLEETRCLSIFQYYLSMLPAPHPSFSDL